MLMSNVSALKLLKPLMLCTKTLQASFTILNDPKATLVMWRKLSRSSATQYLMSLETQTARTAFAVKVFDCTSSLDGSRIILTVHALILGENVVF